MLALICSGPYKSLGAVQYLCLILFCEPWGAVRGKQSNNLFSGRILNLTHLSLLSPNQSRIQSSPSTQQPNPIQDTSPKPSSPNQAQNPPQSPNPRILIGTVKLLFMVDGDGLGKQKVVDREDGGVETSWFHMGIVSFFDFRGCAWDEEIHVWRDICDCEGCRVAFKGLGLGTCFRTGLGRLGFHGASARGSGFVLHAS